MAMFRAEHFPFILSQQGMFRTEHLEISAGLGRFPSVEEIVFREGSSFLNGSARDSLAAFTFLVRVAH
jgi:hypothetical protein